MVSLRLVWWVFWRGLLYGGITGIALGTLFSPFSGAIYGVLIGTLLGAALGLLDGILLTALTRLFFRSPADDRARYIECVRLMVLPVDLVIVLAYSLSMFGYLGIIPVLLTAAAVIRLSPGFADYAITHGDQIPSRNSPVNVLS